jgi:hypothetical protein
VSRTFDLPWYLRKSATGAKSEVLKLRIRPPERMEPRKNTGIHHNPKRERGIPGDNAGNAKTQSLTYVSGCDVGKRAISKSVSEGSWLDRARFSELFVRQSWPERAPLIRVIREIRGQTSVQVKPQMSRITQMNLRCSKLSQSV